MFDGEGRTRTKYRGAFVFMSAKTDSFLPREDLLKITRSSITVFAQADVFLMCQTRSPAVIEDLEIFTLLCHVAKRKKVAVSFSIATDLKEEQRRIERGGLSPERRLSSNPPKDTDGRREGSGRGWVRELQGRWPGVLG